MPPAAPTLPAELAAFLQSGISITIAGRDDRLVPSLSKGVGCRIDEDGRAVTVLLFADAGEAVARDITRNGLIAVVWSQPTTNRTFQLKGRDARPVPTTPADVALARRHLALFTNELGLLGWDQRYVDALFWHDPEQLIALRFTPEFAFAQTPGPGAGAAICLPAGRS